jgi:hypothetical protein
LENGLYRDLEQLREVLHWRAGKIILGKFRMCALYKMLVEISNREDEMGGTCRMRIGSEFDKMMGRGQFGTLDIERC